MKYAWKRVRLKIDGEWRIFQNLKDAARHFNMPYTTVYQRTLDGWSVSKALRTPARHYTPQVYKPNPEIKELTRSLIARRLADDQTNNRMEPKAMKCIVEYLYVHYSRLGYVEDIWIVNNPYNLGLHPPNYPVPMVRT